MSTLVTKNLMKSAGKLAGNLITNNIFGGKHLISGKKLNGIHVQKARQGEVIPNVYGSIQVAGNIIWASDVNEYINTKKTKITNDKLSEYTYTISLAIGICEGEISSINRIWADDVLITDKKNIRIYKGTKDQKPDPYIEAVFAGEQIPKHEGLAYVVLQEFNITNFNNRVPTFKFEVCKHLIDQDSPENLVESLVVIPGCGEFVYDTEVQYSKHGAINQHHTAGIANSVVSLEQIKTTLPNVKWLAPVVSWFGTSLNPGECNVVPAVENHEAHGLSEEWEVAGIKRENAYIISRKDVQLSYGGTPTDASIIRYLQHIKNQGYKVMFYPMMLLDVVDKPWRGRMTGSPDEIKKFFENYNKFILHYAELVKDFADAFLIGSEMQDMTKVQDSDGNFPAVDELIKLADQVKAIMGDKVKISYAANWGEYHSINGIYYMDKLWASKSIDFVGIDAYFPLTDVTESEYNVRNVINGWDSGEGYDYYLSGEEKIPLGKEYAWKNIEFWWSNRHTNPDGKETEWEPKMKKIWFTEYGFPSVSCATNQPNLFSDSSTSESNYPKHSTGQVDILAQRVGIQGTEMRWKDSEMVERKFLWTWDARPYPAWPSIKNVWADGGNWTKGHWVNGKVGVVDLKTVVRDLCIKAGMVDDDIDVSELSGIVYGMIIDDNQSARDVIKTLQQVYQFDVFESDGKIKFISNNKKVINIEYENVLDPNVRLNDIDYGNSKSPISIEFGDKDLIPSKVSINYIGKDFEVKKHESIPGEPRNTRFLDIDLPIVLADDDIGKVATNIMQNKLDDKNKYEFQIPAEIWFEQNISPGDLINIAGNQVKIKRIDINSNNVVKLTATTDSTKIKFEPGVTPILSDKDVYKTLPITHIEAFKIPGKKALGIAAGGYGKWFGCNVEYDLYSKEKKIRTASMKINTKSVLGSVESFSQQQFKEHFTIDRNSQFVVRLDSGKIFSINEEEMFTSDKNLAMIGNEIVKFSDAKLQSDGTYIISNMLRCLYGTSTDTYDRFILLDKNFISEINIEEPVDKIEFKVKTFLDKKLFRATEKYDVIKLEVTDTSDLISPINLKRKDNLISWTPRKFSEDLFDNEMKHGFYIKFLNQKKQIIHQDYTNNYEYVVPEILSNEDFTVSVATFDKNQGMSSFISI